LNCETIFKGLFHLSTGYPQVIHRLIHTIKLYNDNAYDTYFYLQTRKWDKLKYMNAI